MINKVYIVSELISYISGALEVDPLLNDLWITGEVANASTSASGHSYFSLREENSSFRCVLFSRYTGSNHIINGHQVNVHGRVAIYAARGEIQIIADIVQPVGAGLIAAEFELLRQKLESEGFFDPSRKRPLPAHPKRIGLVTSEFGAVFHDISETLARRYPVTELVLCGAQVQGLNSELEISEAIKKLNEIPSIEVIIIARGGGSLEDLHAFNSEKVARSIHASKVPVVSGVGHETDVTIADWVADVRAPTPTAAAELVAPSKDAINLEIATAFSRASMLLTEKVNFSKLEIKDCTVTMAQFLPKINDLRQLVDGHLSEAKRAISLVSTNNHTQLVQESSALQALNPVAVLRRGYSVLESETTGKRIASISSVKSGDSIKAVLSDGFLEATIKDSRFVNRGESKNEDVRFTDQTPKPNKQKKVVKNDRSSSRKSEQHKLF